MATKLTTPEVRPDITHQAITRFVVEVPHVLNDTQDDIEINRAQLTVRYRVVSINADGEPITRVDEAVGFVNWPASVKTDMRAIYSALTIDAKNKGLIEPGTDEDL